MRAVVSVDFGNIDKNIQMDLSRPMPPEPKEGEMLIKVLACALAPGDVRLFEGFGRYMQMPEGGHPYVIGSDVSGVVVKVAEEETKFHINDYVVCRFDEPKPNGGVAEYRLVKTWLSEKCPASIDPVVACGLPASAMAAKRVTHLYVKPGNRVLILGGSGGVGSSMIQYAKEKGASFVAAVSTQEDLCRGLGADQVVDYRTHKWWDVEEFQETPFDVILDMVNGDSWPVGILQASRNDKLTIRKDGRYACLMTGVETEIDVHGSWAAFKLILSILRRMIGAKLNSNVPNWEVPEALKLEEGDLAELFLDVTSGKLKPVIDPASPFEFDEQDVRKAMHLQKSKHAHGKVVIKIADKLLAYSCAESNEIPGFFPSVTEESNC